MLRSVALVRVDVSVDLTASFIIVRRIGELGTTLTVTSNRRTLRRNTISYDLQVIFLYSMCRVWQYFSLVLGCACFKSRTGRLLL
jgi:hypothetical protein